MAKYVTEDNLVRYTNLLQTNGNILKRNQAYSVGNIVWKGQVFLKCLTAGTTASTAATLSNVIGTHITDGTVEWVVIDPFEETIIKDWVANGSYGVNQVVLSDGILYRCKVANSDSSFDGNKWEMVHAGSIIPHWQTNKVYNAGSMVMYNGTLYRCLVGHTSKSFVYDASNWEIVRANIEDWASSRGYIVGDLVLHDYRLYRVLTAGGTKNFVELRHRPHIPEISDWKPYIDISTYGDLLVNMRFENKANAYLEDFGMNVKPPTTSFPVWDASDNVVPAHPGFGGYCGAGHPSGWQYDSVGPVCYIDMRELFPGTSTTREVLDAMYEAGGLTIETIEWWYKNSYLNMQDRVRVFCNSGGGNSHFTAGRYWWESTTAQVWNHFSYNISISGYDPTVTGTQTVTISCNIYVNGVYLTAVSSSTSISSTATWGDEYYLQIYNGHGDGTNNRYGYSCFTNLQIWKGILRTANFDVPTSEVSFVGVRRYDYLYGEYVTRNNKLYRCLVPSEVDNAWVKEHWQLIGGTDSVTSPITIYEKDVDYLESDVVLYNGNLYRCISPHTSTLSFDMSKWEVIYASINEWDTEVAYKTGTTVVHNNKIYRCNTSHISDSSDFSVDIAKWDLLGGGSSGIGLEDWQANHAYSVGDIFVAENQIYKVVNAFTSGATFSVTSDIEEYVPKELTASDLQDIVDAFNPAGSGGGAAITGILYEREYLPVPNKTTLEFSRTWISIDDIGYSINIPATIDLASANNWDDSQYTSAASRAGKDFYIYACKPSSGSMPKFVLSHNSTIPTGYTATDSRKIGGFHCLCADVGTISGHTLSGYVAGDILPASVWDLNHRAISDNEGINID